MLSIQRQITPSILRSSLAHAPLGARTEAMTRTVACSGRSGARREFLLGDGIEDVQKTMADGEFGSRTSTRASSGTTAGGCPEALIRLVLLA